MLIKEIENTIVEEFEIFGDDWESKYEHIIELGKQLPIIKSELKTEERLIKGCQSRVWLNSELQEGKLVFTADSDAIITKGMIALLLRIFSNQKPEDILKTKIEFIDRIGLKEHLSPTRANGLISMINKIKEYAMLNLSTK